MRYHLSWRLVGILIVGLATSEVTIASPCPEGRIMIKGVCVYKDTCEDGRGFLHGKCVDKCWDGSALAFGECPGAFKPSYDIAPIGDEEPKRKMCSNEVHLAKDRNRPAVAVFVGSHPRSLFSDYIASLKKNKIQIDQERLTVVYMNSDGKMRSLRFTKLSLGEYLLGFGPRQKWKKILKNVQMKDFNFDFSTFKKRGWDIVCGMRDDR